MIEDLNRPEKGLESIPTAEEVHAIFERLIRGARYKELRKLEDERGLLLWEIVVPGKDGKTEYEYMRKGHHSGGQTADTAIHAVYYNRDGMPRSGHQVATYTNGEWKFIS